MAKNCSARLQSPKNWRSSKVTQKEVVQKLVAKTQVWWLHSSSPTYSGYHMLCPYHPYLYIYIYCGLAIGCLSAQKGNGKESQAQPL